MLKFNIYDVNLSFVVAFFMFLNARIDLCSSQTTFGNGTFKFVQVIFRHGDRSAITPYKNDPFQEDSWPQGLGQLSKLGKEQSFNLGKFFSDRYQRNDFLNTSYLQKEIYACSTDFDRALMTAQCVLAGLYPPAKDQQFNLNIPWQPIPVHVRLDVIGLMGDCPRRNKLNSDYSQAYSKRIELDNQEFIEYVANHTGEEATLGGLIKVVDPIFCEHTHNFSLPAWLTSNNTYEKLMSFGYDAVQMYIPTLQIARLKGGEMLGFMVQKMKDKINNANMTEKMFIYSGHDSTLYALMGALQVFNKIPVPYRACIMLELVETSYNNYSVQILYRNDSTQQPFPLAIPDCDYLCPFEKFVELTKRGIPNDIEKECALESALSSSGSKLAIAISVISGILLVMFIVFPAICYLRYRSNQAKYRLCPDEAFQDTSRTLFTDIDEL
ncbi:hypothetical protein ScPMuIL_015843 [Solemya velum]